MTAHFEARIELAGPSCASCTRACSARAAEDVALQTSTSEGIGAVLAGHGPRAGRRDRDVRQRAPRADRAADRRPRPRRGDPAVPLARRRRRRRRGDHARRVLARVLDHRRARARPRSPSVDVPVSSTAPRAPARSRSTSRALGCAAYAASGQKWLCGADGTGMLYVSPALPRPRARRSPPATSASQDTSRGPRLRAPRRRAPLRHAVARRARRVAFSLAATRLHRRRGARRRARARPPRSPPGWRTRSPSAGARSRRAAPRRSSRGRTPTRPRPRERLAAAGVVLRDLPGHAVRARLRRRLERRVRPRAAARRALRLAQRQADARQARSAR